MTALLTKAGQPRKLAAGGRPKILADRVRRTYDLDRHHLDLITQWQRAHNCSASEAVRQMIERSADR